MTNYCINRLEIKGKSEDITDFAESYLKYEHDHEHFCEPIIDFPRIVPKSEDFDQLKIEERELNEWGACLDRVSYNAAILTENSYLALFSCPWGAPEEIIYTIAKRSPRLTIRFVGVEEGNEYCFELTARGGVIETHHPVLTDAFIEEVYGEGEIEERLEFERDFWEGPSRLHKPRMRHFRHWRDQSRLKDVLANYQPYIPPHKGLAALMEPHQAEENFAYFLSQKNERINILKNMLKKFNIDFSFNESFKKSLDTWLYRFGGLLYVEETPPSFYTNDPTWDGKRHSLNVIFDLGVCLGDFAIRETPGLGWELDRINTPRYGGIHESYLRPALMSARPSPRGGFPRDVLAEVYKFCSAHCNESYFRKRGGPMHSSRQTACTFFSSTLRNIHQLAAGEAPR